MKNFLKFFILLVVSYTLMKGYVAFYDFFFDLTEDGSVPSWPMVIIIILMWGFSYGKLERIGGSGIDSGDFGGGSD